MERTCEHCGRTLPQDARWCSWCGHAVPVEEAAAGTQAANEARESARPAADGPAGPAVVTRSGGPDDVAAASGRDDRRPALAAFVSALAVVAVGAVVVATGAGTEPDDPVPESPTCTPDTAGTDACVVEVLADDGNRLVVADDGAFLVHDAEVLRAFEPGTGQPRWAARMDTALFRVVPAGPDAIVVERPGLAGPELVALDLASGQLMWASDPEADWEVLEVVVGADELPLVLAEDSSQPGQLVALSLEDGQPVWTVELEHDRMPGNPVSVAADRDTVVLADGGAVTVIDRLSGAVRWSARWGTLRPPAVGAAWIVDGVVVAPAAGEEPGVAGRDARSGEGRWTRLADPEEPWFTSVVGLAGDHVLLLTGAGIEAVRASDGAVSWTAPGVSQLATPLPADLQGRDGEDRPLVVRRRDGSVERLEPATGDSIWQTDAPHVGPVVVAAEHVILHQVSADMSAQVLDLDGEVVLALDAARHPSPTFVADQPLTWLSGDAVYRLATPG